jgi:uncharacterized protein (TIGR00369 family)
MTDRTISKPTRQPPRRLTSAEVDALIDQHFPEVHHGGRVLSIDAITDDGACVRLSSHSKNLRPGGTVSGPAMFTLADYGAYVAILGQLGDSALQAVTTNITLNFIKRPQPGDILADIRLIKTGKRLIVIDISMFTDDRAALVAHAIATYARP